MNWKQRPTFFASLRSPDDFVSSQAHEAQIDMKQTSVIPYEIVNVFNNGRDVQRVHILLVVALLFWINPVFFVVDGV